MPSFEIGLCLNFFSLALRIRRVGQTPPYRRFGSHLASAIRIVTKYFRARGSRDVVTFSQLGRYLKFNLIDSIEQTASNLLMFRLRRSQTKCLDS